MRRLVLISALLLASASAYAGESRDLVLASSEAPATAEIGRPLPPIKKKSSDTPKRYAAEPAKSLDAKSLASRSALPAQASRYGAREAKARRIAARYGIHW